MKKTFLLPLFVIAAACRLAAQPSGGMPGSQDLTWTKLFGYDAAFSAKADVEVSAGDAPPQNLAMNFALLGDKSRTDINLGEMKSAQTPPAAIATMKQMGMDRVIGIARPDLKFMYLIYPGMKSYAKMPLDQSATPLHDAKPKMEKTELGKDTLDGHPCVKNKIVITDESGVAHTFTVWNATDLKDFPVQLQTAERGSQVQIHFSNIKTEKPDAKLFEPPTGFTAYDDVQQMMATAMQKMMQQPATK